jgi:hypothetical protein
MRPIALLLADAASAGGKHCAGKIRIRSTVQ